MARDNPRVGRAPAFQVWAADELADPNVIGLDAVAFGAYWRLRLSEWHAGALPNDPNTLAGIARVAPTVFARMWSAPAFCALFRVTRSTVTVRANDAERARHANVAEGRAKAGKAGARARWK